MNARAACLVLGVLVACAATPPVSPAPTAPVVSSTPVVSSEASAEAAPVASVAPVPVRWPEVVPWAPPSRMPSKACTVLDAEQTKASKQDAKPPKGSGGAERPAPSPCLPAQGGAWSLVSQVTSFAVAEDATRFDPLCEEDDSCPHDAIVRFTPTHAVEGGKPVAGASFRVALFNGNPGSHDQLGVYDLDGDGRDELLVVVKDVAKIYTLREGKVREYAPASAIRFEALVDADGDGRPDLRLPNPFSDDAEPFRCGKRGGHPLMNLSADITLIAHGLPDGTFSAADNLARRVAQSRCRREPPEALVRKRGSLVDNEATRQNVACARLWGWETGFVLGYLDEHCQEPEDNCEALFAMRESTPTAGCAGLETLREWARAKVPLSLK